MKLQGLFRTVPLLVAAALLAACASTGPRDGFAETDDYEPTSRAFHSFNTGMDRYVVRPVTQAYDFATPALVQHMVGNGLNHIDLTKDFANYLLQGDVDRSLETLGRFTLNTILGMGGLLDPATEFGLPKETTDFGLTLASYGVGEGTYLVLPVIGPTTVRDAAGFVVDRAFDPLTYAGAYTDFGFGGTIKTGVGIVDARNRNFDIIDEILYESEDSYVTLRAAYLQRRRAQVSGGVSTEENLPDIFEDNSKSN